MAQQRPQLITIPQTTFPFGVWQWPVGHIPLAQSLGINEFIGFMGESNGVGGFLHPLPDWAAQLKTAGINCWVHLSDLKAFGYPTIPNLVGILQPDEPEEHRSYHCSASSELP